MDRVNTFANHLTPNPVAANKFERELIATARAIASPGKGILAADESTGKGGTKGKGPKGVHIHGCCTSLGHVREVNSC